MKNFFKNIANKFKFDTNQIFEERMGFQHINTATGFLLGAMLIILISAFNTTPAQIIKIPVVQYVERPTAVKIVKVPVKLDKNDQRQIQCLAENTYFEAGNQSTKGKIAVNNVVMNRVNDPSHRFGKNACAVVSQKTGHTCQFSWKCIRLKIHSQEQFTESKRIAEQVYLGNIGDVTHGAKFYHATYVHPRWNLQKIAQIGQHIFYREG